MSRPCVVWSRVSVSSTDRSSAKYGGGASIRARVTGFNILYGSKFCKVDELPPSGIVVSSFSILYGSKFCKVRQSCCTPPLGIQFQYPLRIEVLQSLFTKFYSRLLILSFSILYGSKFCKVESPRWNVPPQSCFSILYGSKFCKASLLHHLQPSSLVSVSSTDRSSAKAPQAGRLVAHCPVSVSSTDRSSAKSCDLQRGAGSMGFQYPLRIEVLQSVA